MSTNYGGYHVQIQSGDTYWQTAYDQVKQITPEGQEVDLSKVQQYTEEIQDLTGQKATELQVGTDMILPAELALDEISADVADYSGQLTQKQSEVSSQTQVVSEANTAYTEAMAEYNGITIPDAVTETDEKTGETKVTNQDAIDTAKQKQQEALEKMRQAAETLQTEQGKLETLQGEQEKIESKLSELNQELTDARAEVDEKTEDLNVKLEEIDSQIEATNGQLEQAQKEVQEQQEQQEAAKNSLEGAKEIGLVGEDGKVISEEDAKNLEVDPTKLASSIDKTSSVEYEKNEDGTKTKTTTNADGSKTVEKLDKDGKVISTETTEANENTQTNVAQHETTADQIQKYLADEKQMLSQADIKNMDIDGDGEVTILDATAAQQKAANIKESNSEAANVDGSEKSSGVDKVKTPEEISQELKNLDSEITTPTEQLSEANGNVSDSLTEWQKAKKAEEDGTGTPEQTKAAANNYLKALSEQEDAKKEAKTAEAKLQQIEEDYQNLQIEYNTQMQDLDPNSDEYKKKAQELEELGLQIAEKKGALNIATKTADKQISAAEKLGVTGFGSEENLEEGLADSIKYLAYKNLRFGNGEYGPTAAAFTSEQIGNVINNSKLTTENEANKVTVGTGEKTYEYFPGINDGKMHVTDKNGMTVYEKGKDGWKKLGETPSSENTEGNTGDKDSGKTQTSEEFLENGIFVSSDGTRYQIPNWESYDATKKADIKNDLETNNYTIENGGIKFSDDNKTSVDKIPKSILENGTFVSENGTAYRITNWNDSDAKKVNWKFLDEYENGNYEIKDGKIYFPELEVSAPIAAMDESDYYIEDGIVVLAATPEKTAEPTGNKKYEYKHVTNTENGTFVANDGKTYRFSNWEKYSADKRHKVDMILNGRQGDYTIQNGKIITQYDEIPIE